MKVQLADNRDYCQIHVRQAKMLEKTTIFLFVFSGHVKILIIRYQKLDPTYV